MGKEVFMMWSYLLFNFLLYSFLGYVIEQFYALFTRKHFKSEGFLYGPFKPMYGFAMTLLVFFKDVLGSNFFIMLVLALIVPTAVEYMSGFLIKSFWGILYWDYSNVRPNFQGLICLPVSIAWMGLCLVGVYALQPLLNTFFISTFLLWQLLSWAIVIYFITDFFFTLRRLAVVS